MPTAQFYGSKKNKPQPEPQPEQPVPPQGKKPWVDWEWFTIPFQAWTSDAESRPEYLYQKYLKKQRAANPQQWSNFRNTRNWLTRLLDQKQRF